MTTLIKISDKEREYHLYQSRQNALREQKTIQISLEQGKRAVIEAEEKLKASEERLKASEESLKASEESLKASEESLKASEVKFRQLEEMLKKQGLDPDS